MGHIVPGPWLLAVLNGVVLAVVLVVVGHMLVEGSLGAVDADASWTDEAAELAREIQRAAEPEGTPVDPDRVSRQLLPLAGRIQGHVHAAPASADAGLYRRLFELGLDCQRVAAGQSPHGGLTNGVFLEDRLDSLREEAAAVESAAARD